MTKCALISPDDPIRECIHSTQGEICIGIKCSMWENCCEDTTGESSMGNKPKPESD